MNQGQRKTCRMEERSASGEKRSDRELVAEILSKDRKATAEFVARYADHVYAYVRRRLIPRADLVEDLVQEVFLAAWESLTSSGAIPHFAAGCLALRAFEPVSAHDLEGALAERQTGELT